MDQTVRLDLVLRIVVVAVVVAWYERTTWRHRHRTHRMLHMGQYWGQCHQKQLLDIVASGRSVVGHMAVVVSTGRHTDRLVVGLQSDSFAP